MGISSKITKILSPIFANKLFFETATKDLFIVFNFHDVSDTPSKFCLDNNLNVRPDIFFNQINWIKNYFNIINPYQLLESNFDRPAALITFDDGYSGVFNQGARILKSANVPAVVFMNMAPVYGETFWSGLVCYLIKYDKFFKSYIANKYKKKVRSNFHLYCKKSDIDEYFKLYGDSSLCKAISYYGEFASKQDLSNSHKYGIYLANHLYNHFNALELTRDELELQFLYNESLLSNYENNVPFFSYPFGQPNSCYSTITDDILFSLGAKYIFTAFSQFNRNIKSKRIHRTSMFENVNSELIFRSHCIIPASMNYLLRRKNA
jgi:peptidoglycan/xylan/chitin deacetylase (PgdA/CDA1 family)